MAFRPRLVMGFRSRQVGRILATVMTSLSFLATSCNSSREAANIHAYFYSRSVIPGMVPGRETGEPGGLSEKTAQPIVNYFLYVTRDEPGISVSTIWIQGKAFEGTAQQVNELPVVIESGGPGAFRQSDTLVSSQPGYVWRIIPGEPKQLQPSPKLRRLVSSQEVIIELTGDGKHLLRKYGQFKKLTPIVLQ